MKRYLAFPLVCVLGLSACKKGSSDEDIPKTDPVVDFSFSIGDGFAPDTIQFSNHSSNAESYQWDFSDGSSSDETGPSHVFQNPGIYNVKLTGNNSSGFSYIIKPITVEPDTELTSSRNYVIAESVFANVFEIVQEAVSGCNSGILGGCGNITNDTLTAPHILTIDFGSSNCAGADQKLRRGKIVVSYSGHFIDSGNVYQVSFTNFYESNHRITGNITATNNGDNTSNHLNYSLSSSTKIFLANSPDSISWNAQKNIEWMQGENTASTCNDDTYKITGTSSGILFRGKSFSSTIISAIQKQILCPPIVIGKATLTPQGKTA